MKHRLSKTLFLPLCFFAVACTMLDRGRHDAGGPRASLERGDTTASQGGSQPLYDTIIYTSGVRFRNGYDWRIDTLAGDEPRELVLFRGGELIDSFPVGYAQEVSADPDMHRIVDAHLYTDYSSARKTIIKKDGKTLFTFDGRETFCGFMVLGSDVWTLGKNRSGEKGVYLRKNGDLVFFDGDGLPFGQASDSAGDDGGLFLSSEGDDIPSFFYQKLNIGQDKKARECYLVHKAEATLVPTPENMSVFYDVKIIAGKPIITGQVGTSRNTLSIYLSNHLEHYAITGANGLIGSRIIPLSDGGFMIKGEARMAGSSDEVSGFLIGYDREITYFDSSVRLVGCYDRSGVTVSVTCNSDGSSPVIDKNGWKTYIDGRFCYISKRCGRVLGKRFYMAFNPITEGMVPFVEGGPKRQELYFNGFITDVWLGIEPHQSR